MKFMEKAKNLGVTAIQYLAQDNARHNSEKSITPGMPELLRKVAAEGAVLLENGVLPFAPGTRLAVFGRTQINWFFSGYGSGGDVNAPYQVNLLDALRSCKELKVNEVLAQTYERFCVENPAESGSWGQWPCSHPEMHLTDAVVKQASTFSPDALIVIGRCAGEDRDSLPEKGSYYLTDEEVNMLRLVTRRFPNAVLLLNIGSVMDLSFLKDYSFGAVLILWHGGMESGNAAADLLLGKSVPSGRLTDTVALRYEDYPSSPYFGKKEGCEYREDIYLGYRWLETFSRDRVLYPFGYGLSYTTFQTETVTEDPLHYRVTVTNTGSHPGKHTMMLFVEKPCGVLGNPARELVSFAKTGLLEPGQSQTLCLHLTPEQLASYDDSGLTGHKSCYVIQPGLHRLYVGTNVRDAELVHQVSVEALHVVQQLSEAAAPAAPFPIVWNHNGQPGERTASPRMVDWKQRILENLPKTRFITGDKGYKLKDVQSGRVSMEAFVAQLSDDELEAITRGAGPMNSPLGPRGNAGVLGGVNESLRKKGIPPVAAAYGSAGVGVYESCSLLPCGTLLACTFDQELVETVARHTAQEMRTRGVQVLLAPGMNLHRNPLCGRNFEYFSEDPLVTGKIAAAFVRGIQSAGCAACPGHFACNNQEKNRHKADSVVSERALRELYLKGFEICVKEAAPKFLMTGHNKLNGVWCCCHYDLATTIARREWGYRGCFLTDWWMQYTSSPEFPRLRGNGYRIRAGVDVLMPGSKNARELSAKSDGTALETLKKEEGITLGELQSCAAHVLQSILALENLK